MSQKNILNRQPNPHIWTLHTPEYSPHLYRDRPCLHLDVARNAITASGVEQWVSVIPSCSLSSLCLTLSENRIGDCGAQLLRTNQRPRDFSEVFFLPQIHSIVTQTRMFCFWLRPACLNCHSLRILKLSLDDCSIPTLFPAAQGQRLQSQLTVSEAK